jgi:ubiquinone/menaquinone biosynthesis C-methylase UbiE
MEEFWSYMPGPSGQPGPNYWTYFAERLAELAVIPSEAAVLDIGTFDGNVLFEAMKVIDAQGYGIGIDLDKDGFQSGVVESSQRGWKEKVSFLQMDANSLGFAPETFDTILANFVGWDDYYDFRRMEFINRDKMTLEIERVLRPGGQVGIGSWVEQSDLDWIGAAFKSYLPEVKQNIPCYAQENPVGYEVILQQGGFKNVRVFIEKADFVSPDAGTWWRQMELAASACFQQVTDANALESFKEQVFEDLREIEHPEGIRFSKTVLFAFGVKPG